MRHQLIIELKPARAYPQGLTLVAEHPDRATAEHELRCMQKAREHRWGRPVLYVQTVDGQEWSLSCQDIAWPVTIQPAPETMSAS